MWVIDRSPSILRTSQRYLRGDWRVYSITRPWCVTSQAWTWLMHPCWMRPPRLQRQCSSATGERPSMRVPQGEGHLPVSQLLCRRGFPCSGQCPVTLSLFPSLSRFLFPAPSFCLSHTHTFVSMRYVVSVSLYQLVEVTNRCEI